MKIVIPIHSFVDLITNSSTEIYVYAGESTLKAVKELVDNILHAGSSPYTFDDLFIGEMGEEKECYEGNSRRSIKITTKDTNEAASVAAASILSNLTDLFSIDAAYNG